jgi:hypothetical protein
LSERPDPFELTESERESLLDWLISNDIDPDEVAADGRLTLHDGYVTGNMLVRDSEGKPKTYRNKAVTYHFKKHVKGNWR